MLRGTQLHSPLPHRQDLRRQKKSQMYIICLRSLCPYAYVFSLVIANGWLFSIVSLGLETPFGSRAIQTSR